MKLKYFFLALLIGSGTISTQAQDYDFGVFGGFSFYQGDLSPGLSNGLGNFLSGNRPAIGGIARYNFHPNFSVRGNLNFGWVAAYDKYQNDGTSREARNLSFNSPIVELSGTFEWNMKKYIAGSKRYKWTPYLFAGLGMTYTHPMAWNNGDLVSLGPLKTEVQKERASYWGKRAIQPVIPIGGGLKFNLRRDYTLGIEAGWRMMFTDYLDDVSGFYTGGNSGSLDDVMSNRSGSPKARGVSRGNSNYNDSYFFWGLTLTKTLRPYKCR